MSINLSNPLMAKVAVNKSLLKEYTNNSNDRIVYLKNDDEFQIQLFNPERTTIGAEVYVNGEKLSGILVLKPGERIWLERFTDRPTKFKFSTYEVEDGYSEEVQNAIADNGVITVKFFKERKKSYWCNDNKITISDPVTSPVTWNTVYATNATTSDAVKYRNNIDDIRTSINDLLKTEYSTVKNYTNNATINATEAINSIYTCSCATSSSKSFDGCVDTASTIKFENSDLDTIETGRISEGAYSSQKFNNVNIDFEYFPFNTEIIKILPISRKPYNSSDLNKIYCTECGRKLNPKYKFCPYCGTRCE